MTQEEYNQLDYDYAHCAGANCQKSGPMPASYGLYYAPDEQTRLLYSSKSECNYRQTALPYL